MMTVDDIIGDIVFISLKSVEPLQEIGITETKGHYLIRGHDGMGIWVAHPGLVIVTAEDENGKSLPKDKQIKEDLDATFLITWDNIETIMHYPEREGYDFPSEFEKQAGFMLKEGGKK